MRFCLTHLQLSLAGILATTVLSGCMVGPDFHPPKAPNASRYNETPLPAKTASTPAAGKGGKAQVFVYRKDIPDDWWHLYHSEELNSLINMGIANSPNLEAAYAALRQAQENLNVQIGNSLFPAFNTQVSGQRQLFSAASTGDTIPSGNIFNNFNVALNVSYTLDVWGGARRQIEALAAQVDYQQFQLIAAYLTLTSNIVITSVNAASFQAQLDATKSLLTLQEDQLRVLQNQYRLGAISMADVLSQQTLVSQTRATIPNLQKSLSQNLHALSALVGAYPDRPMPILRLSQLHLPTHLPVSLPSELVRQRPDVRASEALLHAASAQIGVATANLLPQFNLTGAYGWQSSTPSGLFATKTNAWSYGMQITQPIFQGGALFAQRRAAIAAYDQSFAQYKQTVLQAFQNVADTLRALDTDARALRDLKDAELAAARNLRLSKDQYRLGGVSYLTLLNAQQQYQQTVINRIQTQASRYNDTATLFQALGGGWWHKPWCVKECLYEK